jgi:hypothetical protein
VAGENETYDVVCPHCRREFAAELLEGGSARHRGFKCPYCRLFVPYERADATAAAAPAES